MRQLLFQHRLPATLEGRMAGWFALPTTAWLLHLEFQAARLAFNDIALTHLTATRHFPSSFNRLKGFFNPDKLVTVYKISTVSGLL